MKDKLARIEQFLADPERKLPRDIPPHVPTELDLLWVDFLITGEYPPVSRILDIFDGPDVLRRKIETWLKQNPDKAGDLLKPLGELGLLQPGTNDKLVEDDLALRLLIDDKGKLRNNPEGAMRKLGPVLKLSAEDWLGAFLLRAVANWAGQSNLRQHPKLRELMKQHVGERPQNSRKLVTLWLASLDDPK